MPAEPSEVPAEAEASDEEGEEDEEKDEVPEDTDLVPPEPDATIANLEAAAFVPVDPAIQALAEAAARAAARRNEVAAWLGGAEQPPDLVAAASTALRGATGTAPLAPLSVVIAPGLPGVLSSARKLAMARAQRYGVTHMRHPYKATVGQAAKDSRRWQGAWDRRDDSQKTYLALRGMSRRFRAEHSIAPWTYRPGQDPRAKAGENIVAHIGRWIGLHVRNLSQPGQELVFPGLANTLPAVELHPEEWDLGYQWYLDHLAAPENERLPVLTKTNTDARQSSYRLTADERKERSERERAEAGDPRASKRGRSDEASGLS
jgi:hypothetical protein